MTRVPDNTSHQQKSTRHTRSIPVRIVIHPATRPSVTPSKNRPPHVCHANPATWLLLCILPQADSLRLINRLFRLSANPYLPWKSNASTGRILMSELTKIQPQLKYHISTVKRSRSPYLIVRTTFLLYLIPEIVTYIRTIYLTLISSTFKVSPYVRSVTGSFSNNYKPRDTSLRIVPCP